MKKILLTLVICAVLSAPAIAVPTINFSQSTGSWSYTASGADAGTISFQDLIVVDKGLGSTSDALVGHLMKIPDLTVSKSGSDYKVSPAGPLKIVDKTTPSTVYLSGTLANDGLILVNGGMTAYPAIAGEVSSISITQTTPSSAALQAFIDEAGNPVDISISMDGAGESCSDAIQNGTDMSGGSISGSIVIIPAPGAILLGGIGVGLVGWLRRRRTL